MSDQLVEHLATLNKRLERWLARMDPADRLDALSDVHDGVTALAQLVKRVRHGTLTELVETHGLAQVSRALDVPEERMMRLLVDPTF